MTKLAGYATALGLALTLGLASAPGALAKGHDQGSSDQPGVDVGETTGGAQGQGAGRSDGKGKGPSGTPGNSENAGRDSASQSGRGEGDR